LARRLQTSVSTALVIGDHRGVVHEHDLGRSPAGTALGMLLDELGVCRAAPACFTTLRVGAGRSGRDMLTSKIDLAQPQIAAADVQQCISTPPAVARPLEPAHIPKARALACTPAASRTVANQRTGQHHGVPAPASCPWPELQPTVVVGQHGEISTGGVGMGVVHAASWRSGIHRVNWQASQADHHCAGEMIQTVGMVVTWRLYIKTARPADRRADTETPETSSPKRQRSGSPFLRGPKVQQMVSYTSQPLPKRAAPVAARNRTMGALVDQEGGRVYE
jgi:hypothetical protein